MKTKLGLTLLTAACMGLAACMTTSNEARNSAADKELLRFANASSASLAKTTAAGTQGAGHVDVAAAMRKAGVCEKFVGVVEDLNDCGDEGCQDGLPQSVLEFVSCFGIKISGNGTSADKDSISAALANFSQFQNCVCGGSGTLFGNFDQLKWQSFSASASTVAGSSFSGTSSTVAGSSFSGSSAGTGGSGFDGSQSSASGSSFSGN